MTLDELIAYIESRFPAVEFDEPKNRPWNRAPTGDQYVSIGFEADGPLRPDPHSKSDPATAGTLRESAARIPASSEQSAIDLARAAFDQYAKGRNGTLYWRHKPPLVERWSGQYKVYMRLVISDKPPLHPLLLKSKDPPWDDGRPLKGDIA